MRALILAQGDGRRWVDKAGRPYLGIPKHLVTVDGETLIARTVRLLRDRGVDDVVVVGPDDDRYRLDGARLVTLDDPHPVACDMSKFIATRHLWSDDSSTMLLWGDCFITDDAMDLFVAHPGDTYHVFRRPGPSKVTGHRWDESFAVVWPAGENEHVYDVAVNLAVLASRPGKLRATHIRTHLAAMAGLPRTQLDNVKTVARVGMQTHVDDFTDDIDSPAEWRGWFGRYMAGRYDAAVIMPWAGGDAWRERAHDWCRAHWSELGVRVIEGEDRLGGEWFNRSAARNDAARSSEWDVAFFADADTWVSADQFWAAVHLAAQSDQLVLAFTEYVRINARKSDLFLKSGVGRSFARSARINAHRWNDHASGALAISRAGWNAVGGFDERFLSWGGEDRAFWLAANTLLGEADRIDGPAWHWHHPRSVERDKEHPQYQANVALGTRYKIAAGRLDRTGCLPAVGSGEILEPDPEAMLELLREPGAPLAPIAEAAP